MARVADPAELARTLLGRWQICGTTFNYWRTPTRLRPTVEYEIVKSSPLELLETNRYTRTDKGEREFVCHSQWKGDHFVWQIPDEPQLDSAFVVSDTPATTDIIAVHFGNSGQGDSWVNILAHENLKPEEVRTLVARDTYSFELTADEFWRLTWLHTTDAA
ncbi:hypothetical protein [Agrococcus casei]|uniref:Uncharacterized protein n=1 Tax=Agrococcus casei LMG 22410 TaxID=1255656 RepID=A0A1R4FMZ0_9MICO|nr:hypothetical protein [Agrococcus casei]SJM57298.1 hypothetical protein CZ674_05415 [Agrococcus casei LMG 22410]